MPIPFLPDFEELLSSIKRINPNLQDYSKLLICKEISTKFSDGSNSKAEAIYIWYRKDTKVKIESLLQKIVSELNQINHVANEQIAKAILFLFTFYKSKTSIDAINEILTNSTWCEISQFHILNAPSENLIPIAFGNFTFSNLDTKRFIYKCEKSGSDYYNLYGHLIKDKPCIERKRFSSVIINFYEIFERIDKKVQLDFANSCLIYFESISNILFDDFWNNFIEEQNPHISAGLSVLPEKYFREMQGSQSVTFFLKISVNGINRGFVVPNQTGALEISISSNFGSEITNFYTQIKKEYLFSNFEENEANQTFKIFCKFVSKGHRYIYENKTDEGFLHFMIALDLVFGDKNESTKSVSNRCALLTFSGNNSDYNSQKKKLNELYDLRSKYVHQGDSIKNEKVDDIKIICSAIFYCFLRLNMHLKSKLINLTIEQWKKKIDFACSSLDAEETLSSNLKKEIGML